MKKIDFLAWKNDPITKEIFKDLQQVIESTQLRMQSDELLSDNNGLLKLNRLKGYITALEDVINISVEDDDEDGEDE